MSGYNEIMKGQAGRYDPKPDSVSTPKTVAMNTQDMDMKINAPKTAALDSNKGGGSGHMSSAVSFLNKQVRT